MTVTNDFDKDYIGMRYNIIGDIHGLTTWEKLASDKFVNIFVGDYFSPYEHIPFELQKKNFLKIVKLKKDKPDTTVLLIGNHDEDHWHIQERYSRHDLRNCKEISELFEANKECFQVAYAIEDKALVTHAGVTPFWYENATKGYCYNFDRVMATEEDNECESVKEVYDNFLRRMYGEQSDVSLERIMENRNDAIIQWKNGLYRYNSDDSSYVKLEYGVQEVCDTINKIWLDGRYDCFNFRNNCDNFDTYGYSKIQGPMWVRDKTLAIHNIFEGRGIKQFVGHTQHEKVLYIRNVGFADCLQYGTHSLVYDTEEDKVYDFEGKRKYTDITDVYKD